MTPPPETGPTSPRSELTAWVLRWQDQGPVALIAALMGTAISIARAAGWREGLFLEGAHQTWQLHEELRLEKELRVEEPAPPSGEQN